VCATACGCAAAGGGGGGGAGAIHRAAGRELLEACKKLNGCRTGEAKITQGYRLPAQFVIHTVGPVWFGGHRSEAVKLAEAYQNSLLLAQEHGIRSIAFPCISTGVYRFPADLAAETALAILKKTLPQCPSVEKIVFCCYSPQDAERYRTLLERDGAVV